MYVKYLIIIMLVRSVFSMYSSKALEGYPAGYLPDCPGTNMTIPIPAKDLKYLTFTVQGDMFFFKKRKYNYFEMEDLAQDPNMDFRKPTVVYIGGYLDNPHYPFAMMVGLVYKNQGYNVLLLDTSWYTTVPYVIAARNMRSVGQHVAEMLIELTKHGLDPKKLELLGLSLGAQTMSFIAKHYQLLTGVKISRATGMDPAGPCFRNLGPEDRLDRDDADFVDVIETNIDGYGMAAPMGHVNFYVNGGEFQPGDIFWIPCNTVCSHIRSFTLWIAALEYPDRFIAIKCDSVQEARNKDCYENKNLEINVLGLDTDRRNEGIFYLATQNNYPYFLGEKGLRREYEFFDGKVNLLRRDVDDLNEDGPNLSLDSNVI